MNDNGKLPVGIVNTVIEKISDFTKELEILRHQLPEREDLNKRIEKMSTKFDRAMLVIKVVISLVGIVLILSLFGAKLLTYWEESQKPEREILLEKRLDELQNQTDERFLKILERIEELNKQNAPNKGVQDHRGGE